MIVYNETSLLPYLGEQLFKGDIVNPFSLAIRLLNKSEIRYVVVGGFAVVMHGSSRFTPDFNIVVELEDHEKLSRLLSLFEEAEFFVDGDFSYQQFLDSEFRRKRKHDDGVWFFSVKDKQAPTFSVDFFFEYPLDFERLLSNALDFQFAEQRARVCSLEDLMEMKSHADRGQDRIDLENLKVIHANRDILTDEAALQKLIDEQDSEFDKERLRVLGWFNGMTPDEKLNWLQEMLANLGKFCVV